jgi:hypothetical protein
MLRIDFAVKFQIHRIRGPKKRILHDTDSTEYGFYRIWILQVTDSAGYGS